MNKKKQVLYKMIYIALFTALCFVGTLISIPLGASKVHLGNFFCILAGLLCGGVVGGLSGSLGMGINDLVFGYPYTTYIRTFALKFLMGFLVGYLFRLLLKRKIKGNSLMLIGLSLSFLLLIFTLFMYFRPDSSYQLLTLILSALLFTIMLFITIFSFKMNNALKCVVFSLIIGLSVNVVGEFFLRILLMMLTGVAYNAAFVTSLSKLPGAILTSIVTIIFIALLFYPIYKATSKVNKLNDLSEYLGD